MTLRARFAVESRHRHDLDQDASTLRLAFDLVENLGGVLRVSDQNSLNRSATGAQQLEHRSSAFDLFAAQSLFLLGDRATVLMDGPRR